MEVTSGTTGNQRSECLCEYVGRDLQAPLAGAEVLCTETARGGRLLPCAGSSAALGARGASPSRTPGPQRWGLSGNRPNVGTRQRSGLLGLDSLFLEEDGSFGGGRRFLPEGSAEAGVWRGKGGRRGGRARAEPATLWILDWTPVHGRKPVPSAP